MKTKEAMTLDRVLSRMGVASRTSAIKAIHSGRLKVNGRVIRDPECWVRPGRDFIQFDGNEVKRVRKIYLLFYKPKGVISSHGDPSGRKTVYDCLREGNSTAAPNEGLNWVFPVGRLDKDTSGLLLMTNDTEFADFVTSPESGVMKTYLAKTSGLLSDDLIAALAEGVEMKRGDRARPVSVRRTEDRGKYTWLEIVLTEGKNREVRRMIEAVGFKVLKLVRTRIGPLMLEGLEVGKWRPLTIKEVSALKRRGLGTTSIARND